jgi:wyosine [tRNA(Phe)-imidazoG37] synthetase (radical SAM superfamily)
MLFHETFYGPVSSRRLGASLGINLLPTGRKICSFNCIYCECGLNDNNYPKLPLPDVEEFESGLESTLNNLKSSGIKLDHFTFSGNGEPTLHPKFDEIIDITIKLRDKFFPETKIAVLTNSTMVNKEKVFSALKKIDLPICKLDAGTEKMYQIIDQPVTGLTLDKITDNLMKFDGGLCIQTIFLKGKINNKEFDNSTEEEVTKWLDRIKKINPRFVMLYSLDRTPPLSGLLPVEGKELEEIAKKVKYLGIAVEAYYR